jgi:cytochrome c oxidase subunit II
MFQDFPLFPEQASTVARQVDAVFIFVLTITGFFTILIATLVVVFAVRYRRRSEDEYPRPILGSVPLETFWTVVPFLISMFMFFWGARVFFSLYRAPDDALEVYVVGRQWMWKVQHPDGQREINELHIPVGQPVKLIMTSEDVIHSFFVPAFRVKQDVVPGRYTEMWFEATHAGRFHLFCTEYCGTGHSMMIGSVIALEPAEYQVWLSSRAEGSLALEGRKLFLKLQCNTCHTGDSQGRGPVLEDLFGRAVPLQTGGRVVADPGYLRESIRRPDAKIVAGYQPIMPPYDDKQVGEEDVVKLIAYLRSLRRGETPPRIEDAVPPAIPPAAPKEGAAKP